jgi:hypothetical protein
VKQYYDVERDEGFQDTYRQIHIDIPRMSPLISLFQQTTVQLIFERILYIWAIRHPASGYVQVFGRSIKSISSCIAEQRKENHCRV